MSSDSKHELEELYLEMHEDERLDSLRQPGISIVTSTGVLDPDIMLIGEAPGRLENERGIPFIGRAGTNLTNILADIGIKQSNVFMTNVCKYWPRDPSSRLGKARDLTTEEWEACREYLLEEIDIVNPKIVGLMGRSALQAIYPELDAVFSNHAKLLDGKFVPLYHPAVMTWSPDKKALVRSGYSVLKSYVADWHDEPNAV